jgi:uncharacterized protein
LAASPGARRREYRFLGGRAGHRVEEKRDGDVASSMCGTGRASKGDRGLPADRIRPEGEIGTCSVPNYDAGPCGVVGMALRSQGYACGDGGDGRLLEAVEASKRFFRASGFGFNPQFSDDDCACLLVEENIFVRLLSETRFREFIESGNADASKGKEMLTCLSVDSRDEAEAVLAKALAAGGKPWKPVRDEGHMYGCSFQDLDGHVWEMRYVEAPA